MHYLPSQYIIKRIISEFEIVRNENWSENGFFGTINNF